MTAERPDHQSGVAPVQPRTPRLAELTDAEGRPAAAWWRGALIGALALGLLVTVWLLARPLLLLFLAIVIAETLRPVVELLDRWLPRGLSVAVVYVGLILIFVGVGWLVVPSLVAQSRMLVDQAPELVERTRAWADRWDSVGSDRLLQAAESAVSRFGNALVSLPLSVVSSIVEFVVVIFMSIYWLLSSASLGRFLGSLVPPARRDEYGHIAREVGHAMGGYLRGEGIGGLVIAIITFVGLTILGVDYPILLALVAGIGELIPVAGPLLAAVPAVGIALLDSPILALEVVVFYLLLQQFESNLLVPNLIRHQAGVPPLVAIFAVVAGGSIAGILGAIAALPLAAALRVLLLHVGAPAVRRWTGASENRSPPRHPDYLPRHPELAEGSDSHEGSPSAESDASTGSA